MKSYRHRWSNAVTYLVVTSSIVLIFSGALLWVGSTMDDDEGWPYEAIESAQRGDAEALRQLIHKAQVAHRMDAMFMLMPEYHSRDCLMEASRCGQVNIVHLLLDKNMRQDCSLEEKDADGKTALMLARENHHEDVARLLQRAGAKK